MGCGEEARKCIGPKTRDAGLWIQNLEELQLSASKEMLVEVEHAKAHRTEKDKKEMTQFETIVTDGNERAGELAKSGAMLDERLMAEARAKTMQRCAQPCSTQPGFTAWWGTGKTVKKSSRSQKKSGRRGSQASNGVVC